MQTDEVVTTVVPVDLAGAYDQFYAPAPQPGRVLTAQHLHQPVATIKRNLTVTVRPNPEVDGVLITEPTRAQVSVWTELYNRPISRKEFMVTTAGLGVMALGLRSILESKLSKHWQSPVATSPRGFGGGPYGA